MEVKAWASGNGTYGIRVGVSSRETFFDRQWKSVEIEIGGKNYEFPLSGGFWRKCPEIRSPVIRDWLTVHLLSELFGINNPASITNCHRESPLILSP